MSKSGTGQVNPLYYLVPKESALYALIDQYRTSILVPFVDHAKNFSTHRGISKLDFSVGEHSVAMTQAFFFGKRRPTSEWIKSPSGEAVIPRPKSSKARSLSSEFHGLKIKSLQAFLKQFGIESGEASFRASGTNDAFILVCSRPLEITEKQGLGGVRSITKDYVRFNYVDILPRQDGHVTPKELEQYPFATHPASTHLEDGYRSCLEVARRYDGMDEFPPVEEMSLLQWGFDRARYAVETLYNRADTALKTFRAGEKPSREPV